MSSVAQMLYGSVLCLLVFSLDAVAQQPASAVPLPEGKPQSSPPAATRILGAVWHTPWFEGISVTPDQQAKLEVLQKALQQQVRAVAHTSSAGGSEDVQKRVTRLTSDAQVRMRSVLTVQQQQRFDANRERAQRSADSTQTRWMQQRDSVDRQLPQGGIR